MIIKSIFIIICAIKADLQKPLPSQPKNGQIRFHLESSQTGSSLFTKEDQADQIRTRLLYLLQSLYANIINKEDLMVSEGQFSWFLNVDILVMEELQVGLLDYIGLTVRAAFQNLQLPQVFVTTNEQTGKVEVGLVEEIYEDQDNTDKLKFLASCQIAPYILSISLIRDAIEDSVILDCDDLEIQCVDQILHLAFDSKMRIHAIELSKGNQQAALLNAKYLYGPNILKIVKPKILEMEKLFSKLNNQ